MFIRPQLNRILLAILQAPKLLATPISRRYQLHTLRPYLPYHINNKYSRVYFFHIRKACGTSINSIFFDVSCKNGDELYSKLFQSPYYCIISNGYIYAGWNKAIINKGNYFYAFSHISYQKIQLQKNTFTFTCIRDPLERLISHYKMILESTVKNQKTPSILVTEQEWLGENFGDFLERIPKKQLLNQLYMFSAKYNVNEAYQNIKSLSYYFFAEQFNNGIEELSSKLNLPLKSKHI